MAHMTQEHKKEIAVLLKNIIPKTWKYSLGVAHHSTLVLTIRSAPTNLLTECINRHNDDSTYLQLNVYHLDKAYTGPTKELMMKIKDAMNLHNFDKSDSQTDYFHVGHYISMHIGSFDKPFITTV